MRILHASAGYQPFVGGAQTYLQSMSERFSGDGDDVTVLTTTASQVDCFWNPRAPQLAPGKACSQGVAIQRCALGYPPMAPWSFYLLRRLAPLMSGVPVAGLPVLNRLAPWMPRVPGMETALRQFAPRPTIVHAVNIALEWPLIAAARYARKQQIPLVTTPFVHIGQPEVQRNYTMRHQLAALDLSDFVIVQTEREKQVLVSMGLAAKRIIRLGMGVDLETLSGGDGSHFRAEHNIKDPVVTFMGVLTYDKGVIHLCEAMRRLWEQGVSATLVLAGKPILPGGFEAYYRALPEADRARMRVLGQVDGQLKQDMLAATDVFCMPSRVDSFGIVYLEAWAYAKPVVGANAGGVPDVIADGRDGRLVEFGAITQLAETLGALLQDPGLARHMGDAGRAKVMADYTWSGVYTRLRDLYRALVTR